MATEVSETYMLVENLYNAAVDHAKNCCDSQCNVSVFRLKLAAKKIIANSNSTVMNPIKMKENIQFNEWLDKWPI